LISPAIGTLWQVPDRLDATQLIQQLDDAGIRMAAVLSVAYAYGDDRRQIDDEYAQVRAENDWTRDQVARWPRRLVGFCGVSPLKSYALEELKRCAKLPNMRGLKLHLGNSGVELRRPEHVEQLGAIFEAAEAHGLSIVIHMKTRTGLPYGREDATIFLNKVVSRAPNAVVQIAHMAGAGPGYQDFVDDALSVFVDAVRAGDPNTRNLVFDVTTVATRETTAENAALIARRIRELGPHRMLFGADHSLSGNPAPAEAWEIFRTKIPLTPVELRTIAANVPSYMHGR
jgi:predicted TIM-barrel fold metal-dependent hydrolase